jgi:hypothetical protein
MPSQNRFRHQIYTADAPTAPYEALMPGDYPPPGSAEFAARMRAVGDRLRAGGVAAIYLVHGTFAGCDALGILAEIERYLPAFGLAWRQTAKRMVDAVMGDIGNYTATYAATLEAAINPPDEPPIPVRRFAWSSENHHIGRADGAVRLIDELAGMWNADFGMRKELGDAATIDSAPTIPNSEFRIPHSPTRLLLLGHSHAGNVFALMSNLLAGDGEANEAFFSAARPYYRRQWFRREELPHWRRVRKILGVRNSEFGIRSEERGNDKLDHSAFRIPHAAFVLDFVTFGTPIRYGWDRGGYGKLLHFVNHRPAKGLPPYRAPFPPRECDVRAAAAGDYVQQLGIAGTNFTPTWFAARALLADLRLGRLLQGGIRRRDLLDRLLCGMRVPAEGTTLLVDYGAPKENGAPQNVVKHLAGHAVYTRPEWMLFHAEETARRLYGVEQSSPEEQTPGLKRSGEKGAAR